jgi:hypothetical protein
LLLPLGGGCGSACVAPARRHDSTAQHSTAQHSTAQHSTAQHRGWSSVWGHATPPMTHWGRKVTAQCTPEPTASSLLSHALQGNCTRPQKDLRVLYSSLPLRAFQHHHLQVNMSTLPDKPLHNALPVTLLQCRPPLIAPLHTPHLRSPPAAPLHWVRSTQHPAMQDMQECMPVGRGQRNTLQAEHR